MELIGTVFFLFVCVCILFFVYKETKETKLYLKVGNPLAQDCRRCGGSFLRSQLNAAPDGFCGFCENIATKIMKTELKEVKEEKNDEV